MLLAGRVGATHPPGAGPTAPSALATAVTSSDETESHCAGGVANLLSGSWDSTVRLWDMQRIEVSAGGPLDPCLLACLLARLLACLLVGTTSHSIDISISSSSSLLNQQETQGLGPSIQGALLRTLQAGAGNPVLCVGATNTEAVAGCSR